MTDAVMVAIFKALIVLSVLILIIGLIKPKWVLFWMKEPNRLAITSMALILFMASVTGWSHYSLPMKQTSFAHKSEKDRDKDEINELNLSRQAP